MSYSPFIIMRGGTILNKILEALEVHDELNPKLWDGMNLKVEVKNKLLEIAQTFISSLDYALNVADIRFLGSNASYNYNDQSDIDLHIISNFDLTYIDRNVLQSMYNSSKNNFNKKHDISIYDIPVEIYIEDMNSINATNGSYSLLRDEWVKTPQPIEYEIPDYSTDLNTMVDMVDKALVSNSKDEVQNVLNIIYLARKDGLAFDGEASIGNCVFKELRNMGLLDQLRDKFYELESEQLTLESKSNGALDKLVEELVDEMQEPNKEEIEQKEEEYREYIRVHIENVKKAFDKIVEPLLKDEFTEAQMQTLKDNLDIHDKDKSIPFMFDAYRANHYPVNDAEKEARQEDYDIAWEYHKNINPHHWEYWLNSEKEFAQNIDEEAMKLAYAEMLCDWLSFGFRKEEASATGESTEFEVWYNESKQNIKIHPQLEEWFNDKIEKILAFIDENKNTLYESLKIVENCGIMEDVKLEEKQKVKWHGLEFKNEGKEILTEMDYNDYKKDVKFDLEYRVIAPIKVEQEEEFDTYDDVEMDVDIDSLYEAYEDAQKQVLSLTSNEDMLKEIFPKVGLGRVYVGNVEIDEDKLDFDIGFSSIVDPVEEGNEISLVEAELKDQIVELVEFIIDNLDYLSAKQCVTVYTGDTDEDGDPVEEEIYSDDYVSYSICLDTNKTVDIKPIETLTESKLNESSLGRIYKHYSTNPFAVVSACRTELDSFQNKKNSIDLQNNIRSAKLGYIPVDGMWKEAGQTSAEDSYFIPYTGGNFEGFKDWAVDMAKRYNQYSVLISDGEGEIAYYDQQGNVTDDNGIPDEFKDIKFSNDTIDKNIDQSGAGGYTRLKGTDKRFQLQKEDYDPIFYKSTSRNSSTVNKKFAELAKLDDVENEKDILKNLVAVDYGFFRVDDLKHKIKVLYDIDVHFEDEEGTVEFEDVKLTYKYNNGASLQVTNIE